MDISAFYEDSFDTKLWINNILKENGTQDNKEAYTASLVKKLQLYVQQVNSSLEDASQQVLTSLPRVLRDTKSLQQEALLLKHKMAAVKEEIAKVEQNTGQSMATLERLDRIKTKLQQAKQGLHEADNWTLLANDLEEDFEASNLENISSKLLSMQQSLKILVNVGDYEDRKLQLEELKNRLEAMTSPSIVQAFTSGNIEQSALYARIFTSIGRLPQLLKYYHKCQKGTLMQKWRNQLEIEQDESVAQWIHNFYDVLLSNWHAQVKWFNVVFTQHSATAVLIDVYTDLLTSLEPSFNECIDAALKQQLDKLGLLLELKQITKQFASNLFNLIDVGDQGKVNTNMLLTLAQAIYSPFIQYVGNYAAYEQAYLVQQISSLNCVKDDYPDSVQALGLSVPIVMDLLRESKKRCQDLTENCGLCGLLIAIKAFLQNYIDQYRIVLRQIDRAKGIEEDWNMFQMCLTLMQNVGEILMNIQQFEKELTSSALETMRAQCDVDYKHLLLTISGQREYDHLIQNVKEGRELSLLESVNNELQKLCVDIHHTTYQVVIAPISVQLDLVQTARAWNDAESSILPTADLPDYSFAPQEYITQIGQYLMILPQHLEPFLLRDNPALNCALKAADQEYSSLTEDEDGRLADVLLAIIARGTCRSYVDSILTICELKPSACRQLANDIDYLGNILDDLGLALSDSLQQMLTLLRLAPENYQSKSSGCSPRLVAAIRQMRNLTSSG